MKHMTYLLFMMIFLSSFTAIAGTHGDEDEGGEKEVARVI